MATLTISLTGSSVINGSKNWTISDADVQTLISVMGVRFADKGGPPLPPGQALLAWAQNFVTHAIIDVQRKQTDDAVAAISVTPITFT